ncbi:MAG: acetyl-CoA hydrolase/transferase C-terminal domain-containing protein [Bacillota bacterium]|nr:acetyl-CoA hydrolase/transferase C-terminal domain-containing protein [Bacillota bacterium]
MSLKEEYQSKLRTADEIAAMVKSGEMIKYGYFTSKPVILDEALAKRHEELRDVLVAATVTVPPVPQIIQHKESFAYMDWHWSKLTRALAQYYDNIAYLPIIYHMSTDFVTNRIPAQGKQMDWVWKQAGPMDEHGCFNFGPSNTESLTCIEQAKRTVIEVNPNIPRCLGGGKEAVHISQVDYIVEAPQDQMLFSAPENNEAPPEFAMQIATHLVDHIHSGSCIQLGIGDLPNALGQVLKKTDIKDLGIHSEMLVDVYMDMIDSGQANGSKKNFDKYKAVYTFAIGTQKMYDWMHNNPLIASYSVDYTNDPRFIGQQDNMVSINQALQIDLLTQVSAESMGFSQISGNGGMTDFTLGVQWSKGGKSFICLPSTHTDKEGNLISRIVPSFPTGTSVTVTRHFVDYIATEFGIRKLKAQNTWVRTEYIIDLAHPKFRDELIKSAAEAKIWTRTNKQDNY